MSPGRLRGSAPAKKVAETSTLKSVSERIRALELERRELLLEIDRLKRMADGKADALEKEIAMLRDEVKSLRALLSGENLTGNTEQRNKK